MNPDEKREIFHAAVDILVDRIVANAKPKNPGAYAAKTKTALRSQHRADAREIFDAYDDLGTDIDAAQLADLLEPPRPTPAPGGCPTCKASSPCAPALPTYKPEDRPPATDDDRARARAQIARIKAELVGTTTEESK